MTEETTTEQPEKPKASRRRKPKPEQAQAEAPAEETKAKLPALSAPTDDRGILPIIPRDTAEAMRYATGLIRAGVVPDAYKFPDDYNVPELRGQPNPDLVLMGVLKSLEIGLPPQTGVGTIMPINNRFTVWGDGAVALIQRNNVIESFIQVEIGTSFDKASPINQWPDSYGWRVSIKRRFQDTPYVGEFTIADARRAGLWLNARRKPWIMYPQRMLFNRARAFALRDGFADCLMGLGIREEVEDTIPIGDGPRLPSLDFLTEGVTGNAASEETGTEEQGGKEGAEADGRAEDTEGAEGQKA